MRALLQRVELAQVEVDGHVTGRIGPGLLVYLGIAKDDVPSSAAGLARKVAALRIFNDEEGKLNRSVQDDRGGVLVISNFTLMADARKGRRPSFEAAAPPEKAQPLYEAFIGELEKLGCSVARGVFGANMIIRSVAAGPVNVIVDWPTEDCLASHGDPSPTDYCSEPHSEGVKTRPLPEIPGSNGP